jgi:O-6-methylguanine DNA methyltransferase
MRNNVHATHHLACGFTEDQLIAEAFGETSAAISQQVTAHLVMCPSCRALFERYRSLHAQLQALPFPKSDSHSLRAVRQSLDQRLARVIRPRLQGEVWRSPVGDIRIGKTDKGVALVEFVRPEETPSPSSYWQSHFSIENGSEELTTLIKKLEDYFSGKTHSLEWIVDDVLMRSDFQRTVLRATAEVPYGMVVTYQSIADTIGQPQAVRAVAQALRHNPVPIHIPCHRVIGSDGALTGYAGNLVDIKKKILAVEGIPVIETAKGLAISRKRMYVGWRRDRWFCLPQCSTLKEQPAGDRAFIPSRVRAEEMGYKPCDVCRPDLQLFL